jgi:hypothetical protein
MKSAQELTPKQAMEAAWEQVQTTTGAAKEEAWAHYLTTCLDYLAAP